MPNWSFNSLSISGNPEEIAQVKFQVAQPFERELTIWDKEKKVYYDDIVKFDNPVFAFWNIVQPVEFNNYKYWGTKWDVAIHNDDEYPTTTIEIDEADHLVYRFDTAWAPPEEAVAELSRQYPNLIMDMEYEEETGWGGEFTYKAGEIVSRMQYDSRCPECDTYDCIDYDEEAGEQFCTKCDYRS
jgi:hypothetical protein